MLRSNDTCANARKPCAVYTGNKRQGDQCETLEKICIGDMFRMNHAANIFLQRVLTLK